MTGRICSEPGCGKRHYGRGLCRPHYARQDRRRKDALVGTRAHGPDSRPESDRFWSKVDKSGECWLWTGAKYLNGYGVFDNGLAHRISWRLAAGEDAGEALVLHRCDRRACVRPAHLFLGNHADNMADMRSKGRSLTGERNPSAVLTAEQVTQIRALRGAKSQQAIADDYDVTVMTVNRVLLGRTWSHVR